MIDYVKIDLEEYNRLIGCSIELKRLKRYYMEELKSKREREETFSEAALEIVRQNIDKQVKY